jgi:hypothetical protein
LSFIRLSNILIWFQLFENIIKKIFDVFVCSTGIFGSQTDFDNASRDTARFFSCCLLWKEN